MTKAKIETASLRAESLGRPKVDREKGVITGFKVMSLGEARGHGMIADEVTLSQVVEEGNSKPAGFKVRFTHPDQADGLGTLIGWATSYRREGESVVGDLRVSTTAFKTPRGDLGTYVMDLAEKEPDSFGASPVVRFKRETVKGQTLPSMRIVTLKAIDLVDEPATNDSFFHSEEALMADSPKPEGNPVDVAALKTQIMDELKADFAKQKDAAVADAVKKAEEAALAEERKRTADITSLCEKAKQPELAAGYIKEGLKLAEVQGKLLDAMLSANKPLGEAAGKAKPDPENAKFLAEYEQNKAGYLKAGITADEYVASRRVDLGIDQLKPKLAL